MLLLDLLAARLVNFMSRLFLLFFVVFLILPINTKAVELKGLEDTAKSAGMSQMESNLTNIAGTVLNPILSFVGVLFFLLLLYAGILWMTAMGDEKKVEQAKSIITAAVIGLIITASAYAITRFVGSSFDTKTNVTTTNTP